MSHRILIIDDDARYGAWLTAHVGAVLPDANVEFVGIPEFERRRGKVHFRDDAAACDELRRKSRGRCSRRARLAAPLRDQTDLRPIVAIAI
ncbi:MAG: hypothetical protein KIT78_00760 [Steroidobacteraceae bacterium]|nr:hypothetical protein [Steroidobacteraceae bacterium]